ncbi:MAG: LacI family DNA-binding transcriptional regulator [Capsulimonadaceae bacterium]|nr:LacI family DNA-binding transcriptional regulator [Capsulimonadaceae bacterium]
MKSLVVVGVHDYGFFDRCLAAIKLRAAKMRVDVTCEIVTADDDISTIQNRPVSPGTAFFFFGPRFASAAKALHARGLHVVVMGTPPLDEDPGIPIVHGDHEKGGYLAARHLIELGHRRIAYANYYPDVTPNHPRWLGFQRAAYEERLRAGRVSGSFIEQSRVEAWIGDPSSARSFLMTEEAPTGIAAWNDFEAVRLLTVFNQAGISVPGDVSLLGYDALPQAELCDPPLTTIDAGIDEQVDAALYLLDHPSYEVDSSYVVAVPSLIRRGSTGPPRS